MLQPIWGQLVIAHLVVHEGLDSRMRRKHPSERPSH